MTQWDVVIVGGGIHGVGVAQAVAAAGHRALVLERTAIAAGTSSRSSKLIHGGLRYLEQGAWRLVRECLQERALLLRLAPDLVRLQPFILPIYSGTSRRPSTIRAGLSLYALLGGLGADVRFSRLPRRTWGDLDGLRTDGLRAVFQYHDGQTDDRALTEAVMRSAESLGAELRSPAEMVSAVCESEGVEVRFRQRGHEEVVRARVVVNAAGPWAAEVLARIEPVRPARPVDLVQGTHVVVPAPTGRGIYYVESPFDQRAVFVLPWCGATMLGTTEVPHHGPPDAARATPEEIEYLLGTAGHYFPRLAAFGAIDVTDVTAGLRVLPAGDGTASGRSRETILDVDRPPRPRVLTIYGGKLTAYRATAERVLARIAPALPERRPVADTRELPLRPE